MDHFELVSYNPQFSSADQSKYLRIGDTRIPLLLKGKNPADTDAKYFGHVRTLVDSQWNWLATVDEVDRKDRNIKEKLGWDLIPGITDTPFNIENSIQQQIIDLFHVVKSKIKYDDIDTGTFVDMPIEPVDSRIPSTRLVKSYVDEEHRR
jgi:hypothetical protein